jgi:hypothetical protein
MKNLTVYLGKRKLGNMEETRSMVNRLPVEIDTLYTHIWSNIDPADIDMSKRLFEASLFELDGVTIWVAEGRSIKNEPDGTVLEETKKHITKVIWGTLDAHTRGILGISSNGLVSVLHRSVMDWLKRPVVWENICSGTPLGFDAHMTLLKVGVA